jgi:hypothetical protein
VAAAHFVRFHQPTEPVAGLKPTIIAAVSAAPERVVVCTIGNVPAALICPPPALAKDCPKLF